VILGSKRATLDPTTQDRFFPTGSTHDAYVHVRDLLKSATQDLFIVDAYMDGSIYQTLATLAAQLTIRIMTSKVPADFGLEGGRFTSQYPHFALETRRTRDFHDRFVFIDRTKAYHLGPSIKDAGGRSCAIIQLSDVNLINTVLKQADNAWATATPI